MPLSKQVTSLELSKKLKELGVKQESLFSWEYTSDFSVIQGIKLNSYIKYGRREFSKSSVYTNCSAFTVAELGEMLLNSCRFSISGKENGLWIVNNLEKSISADTEADCRAKMLIYLLENGLIKL